MIDLSNVDVAPQVFETDGANVQQLLDEENSELQKQLSVFVDSATVGRMASFLFLLGPYFVNLAVNFLFALHFEDMK